MSIFTEKAHHRIYFGALTLLAIALPFSKFVISLAELVLILNWLLEGNLKNKISAFLKNKTALVITSVFLIHLAGLLYTTDFNYGWEDIRKKAPMLLLPLILSTSAPLGGEYFKAILKLFILSTFVGTLISICVLLKIIPHKVTDIRDISIFVSHIRFSLMICLSIFISGYFIVHERPALKIILSVLITWFITFLIIMESLTGLVIVFVVAIIICLFYAFRQRKLKYRIAGILLVISFLSITAWFFNALADDYRKTVTPHYVKQENYTPYHNPYISDTLNRETENGYFVWVNVCQKELEETWNKRSNFDFRGKDLKGNELRYTILRFLTSKGLNKDGFALNSLSNEEIHSIEKGMANYRFQDQSSLLGRLHEVAWEVDQYNKGGNPSGHSLTQRFEFWKAAVGIIKDHPLFGVGTGDAKIAYAEQYKKMNSPLDEAHRLRAHNQFLAIAVATGIFGLLIFLFSLFFPFISNGKICDYHYLVFFLIVFISMLTEDTLETQAGITFFAFFNSLFLFACPADAINRSKEL